MVESTVLTEREYRLISYSLHFLRTCLDENLVIEVGQEIAPETFHSGEQLPDVTKTIDSVLRKIQVT